MSGFALTPYERPAEEAARRYADMPVAEGMRARNKQSNDQLHKAIVNRDDEFYTPRHGVEDEVRHYIPHFRGKHIHLPCDDPLHSQFWAVFSENFRAWGLRRLTATYHHPEEMRPWKTEFDGSVVSLRRLPWGGDFRVGPAEALLEEADIVITNPPFSIISALMARLIKFGTDYLILGHLTSCTLSPCWKPIVEGRMHAGSTGHQTMKFIRPDGSTRPVGICWLTSLDFPARHERRIPQEVCYSPEVHPRADNHPAIIVTALPETPKDYDGLMALPITCLAYLNPEQFVVRGIGRGLAHEGALLFFRYIVQRVGPPPVECPYRLASLPAPGSREARRWAERLARSGAGR